MEKSDLRFFLFFLIFGSLFTNLQCDENECVACQHGNAQQYSLARLSDEQISQQYNQMVIEFRKSNKIHNAVRIGTYIVCAAALAAICYQLFAPDAHNPVSGNLQGCSLQQLIEFVNDLAERVHNYEIGPNFFSWAYLKSWGYSLVWNPVTMLHVSRFFLQLGDNYLNHTLYCTNLSWFLGEKTKLGLLVKHEPPSTVSYEFAIGQLPKSIEECATAIDGATSALLPVDVDYQRSHLVECCDALVNDLTTLLAFAKYVDSLSTNEKDHFENAKATHHLINCANSFCDKIEACLNGTNKEKFLPFVTSFNTDLQPIIIRFAERLS